MPITHKFRRASFMRGTMVALFFAIIALSFAGWRTQATAFATLTVSNTNDGGPGSLRAAITASNASVGTLDAIEFNLGAGTPTINLLSALPTITDPVTINGNTGGSTRVELNGAGAGAGSSGLTITAGNTTIAGLVINRFGNHGIHILTNGGNTIRNCYLGTDANGTADLGNTFDGVAIQGPPNNTIGGTTAAERNVISGNNRHGVFILVATATGNKVIGNYIGTDATGVADLGNAFEGVQVSNAPNNTVGGTTVGERNVISGNDRNGVVIIQVAASGNKVIGNYIGTDANGTADLGNSFDGVQILAPPNNMIGGTSTAERNVISGNNRHGVLVVGATASGNKVIGNYIGTNVNGTADLGNTQIGVFIEEAPNNTVGGTIAAERNVISGNDLHGVYLLGAMSTGNKVCGNFIGTTVNGTADLGNTQDGVQVINAPNNTVGGTTAPERNVISGNDRFGVYFVNETSTGNKVIGNFIGTDVNGTADLGNALEGVQVNNAPNNTVGGTTAGERNVLSGNDRNGVVIAGATASGNKVSGNYIGTDANGTADLGNTFDGAQSVGAPNNTFGGMTAGERNVISGNDRYGVVIFVASATGNKVIGNYIGTNATGTADLGNTADGVSLQSSNNTVGGTTAAEFNLISGNDRNGVALLIAGTGNAILGNSIFSNSLLGIDLGSDGITANDTLDADTGLNNLQNFPVLTCATSAGGLTTIGGTLNSLATTAFRIEFFVNDACDSSGNGEGQTLLGFQNVTTDASGNAPINAMIASVVAPGKFITATATLLDAMSNPVETSEYSACRVVVAPVTANAGPDQKLILPAASATLAANAPGGNLGMWSVVSGPSTSLSQFSNPTDPAATFTQAGGSGFYILRWTISNPPCVKNSTDDVIISFAAPPTIAKAFSPATIVTGGTSTVTLTLNNSANSVGLVASFTDTLTDMTAVGGGIGGTCAAVSSITIPANATALSFSGVALPPNGSCTVTFPVHSTVIGVHPNTTSGVTTDFTPTAGAASNTANLTVTAVPPVTMANAFNPATITAGSTSTVSLTVSNSTNPKAVVAAFTDTLTNMAAVGGPISGTCTSTSANVLAANATNLSFSGIVLPANGSCVVSFAVRSNVVGVHPNTTSGVTTDQNSTAGAPSNTANLTVNAPTAQTIAKVFNPSTIVSGGTSTVTLTLSNTLTFGVLASFTDTLTNMTAVGGPIGTTCGRLAAITIPANATNLSFSGIVIPGSGSCKVSFPVRSSVVGVHPNTTSGITTDQSPVAGPVSNTANLTVTAVLLASKAKAVRNDFDGDSKSDLAQWRADLGEWQVRFSSDNELHHIALTEPDTKGEYVAVAADFDGDQRTDAGVWRPSDGRWLIKYSLSGELVKAQFGLPGDVPMAADYDGDGRADLAVWRNGDGWHIQRSSNLTEQAFYLGQSGDAPVIGDFDGDGLTDLAVFRASDGHWLLRNTATGMLSDVSLGQAGDTPMAADFDGDGKDDLSVMRGGTSYVRRSVDQAVERTPWSGLQSSEAVVLGDYDGDGRAEPAIWRTAKTKWVILFRQTPR